MKEKKLIASVILGVALVSLITALVAAFAESLTLFIDGNNVKGLEIYYDFNYVLGGLAMGAVLLGIAFVAVFFANKKNRFAVNLGLAIALVAFCIISVIVARVLVPRSDRMYAEEYAMYSSFLSMMITLMVSCALTFAAWLYLTLIGKKESSAKQELEAEDKQEQN